MSIQDYLDFELNVEALDAHKLRITVANSPVGSVSVDTANPFTPDELTRVIGLLEGSIQATRSTLNQEIRSFGEKLFNAIFSGQVYAAYLASVERAGASGLRFHLGLDDAGPLATIPWELLRDPRTDYLALSRQTPITRYPRVLTLRPLVEVRLPLRVLVLISSPGDQDKIDVEGEWRALQEATIDVRNRGLLELDRIDDAQLVTLQHKLREGTEYQVFHYIGHSAFVERSQSAMLAFDNPQTNTSVPVAGEALARELSEENSIRLVVLNACQAARQNISDPFASISSRIVARGVPAVVAMQFSIADSASRLFSQAFYQALSEGYPIEAAMAEARRTISGSLGNFEWATPVLYLRTPTGVLFPRRKTKDVPMSTGGVRELLRTPRGIALSLPTLAVILLAGFVLFRVFRLPIGPFGPTGTTATSTPFLSTGEVDLVVKSLHFSPPHPAPGQHVTVTIVLENAGSADSGPFKWGWYDHDPGNDETRTLQGQVANLGPGETLNVKGDYYPGLWGTYVNYAWVNFDDAVHVTDLVNAFRASSIITSDDPLVVDFTLLPSGNTIVTPTPLKGDEFSQWGLHIAPETSVQPDCKGAAVQVDVQDNANRLITGMPGQKGICSNLPIVFTLDQPIGGTSVKFQASSPGRYTLDLFDANNKRVGTASTDADTTQPVLTIRAPASGIGLTDIRKVRVSGPQQGIVAIQSVAFAQPNQPAP